MMTPKQQRFVAEYVLSGNGVQSATSAGYSHDSAHVTASRLLRNAKVAAAIEAERAMLREQSDLRAQDVIRGLRSIAEDENAPHSSRVSAWKTLGQHLGMFDEQLRIQHTHSVDTTALQEFTVAELLAIRDSMRPAVEAEARVLGD